MRAIQLLTNKYQGFGLGFVFLPLMAQAQTYQPANIYVGPFDLTPQLSIEARDDDNIFQTSRGSETQSTLTIVRPTVSAVADNGITIYELQYQLEDGTYSDTNNSDYTNHLLSFNIDWSADVRHNFEFDSSFNRASDGRTPDSVTGVGLTELNEFDRSNLAMKYTFGADGASGRIDVGLQYGDLTYNTNRNLTDVLDSKTSGFDFTFSLLVGEDARVLFQAEKVDTDFPNNSIRDREQVSYLVGSTWELTGATKGSIRLGVADTDLLNTAGDDTRSTGEIEIEWAALPYSLWKFTAVNEAVNGENNVGDFIDRTSLAVNWNHQWSDAFSSSLSFSHQDDEFTGTNRNDNSQNAGVNFTYALRRWLSFGLGFNYQELDSSDDQVDYEKNTVTLSINASL